MTRKELFLEIGGFDAIYKNGCEDVDLCLRMTEQNKEHYIVHDSVVLHVKGASEGRKLFNDKNSQILQKRWGKKLYPYNLFWINIIMHGLTYAEE